MFNDTDDITDLDDETQTNPVATSSPPNTSTRKVIQVTDPKGVGAVDVRYRLSRPTDNYSVFRIDTLNDANLFARVLTDLTGDRWDVVEEKFTQTTITAFAVE